MLKLRNNWSLNAELERSWYTQGKQGEIEMDSKDLIMVNVAIVSVLLEVGDPSDISELVGGG